MEKSLEESEFLGKEKISKILLKLAPPVMLAQLISALYNIVDSLFVGRLSNDALTALGVIYPLQWVIMALSVGTGVGVNAYMDHKFAQGKTEEANKAAGVGIILEILEWALFSLLIVLVIKPFVNFTINTEQAIGDAIIYGYIVCCGSIFQFLDGTFSKVHQSKGNMIVPMIAQLTGAIINIILDPILIFGLGPIPKLGVAGAGFATVIGQFVTCLITGVKGFRKPPALKEFHHYAKRIFHYGYSYIVSQALASIYIIVLNFILGGFSDAGVTVLGLYYKMQSFFFIPIGGLQTCVVPIISYNHAINNSLRIKKTMNYSYLIAILFMVIGVFCFLVVPDKCILLFSKDAEVMKVGVVAFRIIGCSFFSAVFSLMTPVFFQSIGEGKKGLLISLTRQIFCLIPIFYLFSLIGLDYTWIAFPISETVAGIVGIILYHNTLKKWGVSAFTKKEEKND